MNGQTVILAAGDFPKRGGEPWRLLAAAGRVVACDGAARTYRRAFRKWPDFIVGDLDSFRRGIGDEGVAETRGGLTDRIVRVREQETNDLAKAIAFCRARGWNDLVIIGATGKREDHAIGNVFRALEAGVRLETEYGTFWPVCGTRTIPARKGAGVSVFASDAKTRMTSRGLKWKLDGVVFESVYRATLNRATGSRITVTSDRPAFVYVARDPFVK